MSPSLPKTSSSWTSRTWNDFQTLRPPEDLLVNLGGIALDHVLIASAWPNILVGRLPINLSIWLQAVDRRESRIEFLERRRQEIHSNGPSLWRPSAQQRLLGNNYFAI